MIYALRETKNAAPLFAGWQETMIWSCLQGVMGTVYADSPIKPASAMAVLGDFCFLAGKPEQEFILAEQTYGKEGFMIMTSQDRAWETLIESSLKEKAKKVIRYATRKEPDVFDKKKLRAFAEAVPAGYTLRMMDEELYRCCGEIMWCRDWVSQYENYTLYRKYGLGVVLLKDKEPVSGASSYSGYDGGIEVEIDTREDHRRRGFACICGAKLILECLDRGLYPGWDAQNKWSAALAQKLGYHIEREYTAYEVIREVKK